MARLPRLTLAGQLHLVQQLALPGLDLFGDETDRRAYLDALSEAAAAEGVAVHAYALGAEGAELLLRPATAEALGRAVQAVGRRFVGAFNRRHGHRGSVWAGRFRSALVEPEATALSVLLLLDGAPGWTSAGHRTGGGRSPLLADPPEFWALGNTPFEREAAYRSLLSQGLPADVAADLRQRARGGWVIGSASFVGALATHSARPPAPRPRGRPAKG